MKALFTLILLYPWIIFVCYHLYLSSLLIMSLSLSEAPPPGKSSPELCLDDKVQKAVFCKESKNFTSGICLCQSLSQDHFVTEDFFVTETPRWVSFSRCPGLHQYWHSQSLCPQSPLLSSCQGSPCQSQLLGFWNQIEFRFSLGHKCDYLSRIKLSSSAMPQSRSPNWTW